MGKRTDKPQTKEQLERGLWPTRDPDAVKPLIPHIKNIVSFDEPCCGNGDLVRLIHGLVGPICSRSSDLVVGETYSSGVVLDLFDITECTGDVFITNPNWKWDILTRIITHLSGIAPTWLLFNADLMHNIRMGPHMQKCVKVVSVGRVSWMNNGIKGFENAAWFLFDENFTGQTEFYGRIK